jgi:hypothetical protein
MEPSPFPRLLRELTPGPLCHLIGDPRLKGFSRNPNAPANSNNGELTTTHKLERFGAADAK